MVLAYEALADIDAVGQKLKTIIFTLMRPFTYNRALMVLEDKESLLNLCLAKLHQAAQEFIYDPKLTEAQNDGRFVNLAKMCMYRILVDNVYKLNLRSRKSSSMVYSINHPPIDSDNEDSNWDLCVDTQTNVPDTVGDCEVKDRLLSNFSGKDREAVVLLTEGRSPGYIASTLGLKTSDVRSLLNTRVRPKLKKIMKIND